MYHSFSIKNFRCFDDLTLEGLGRINLIGGKNNIGKTVLLEALWVHSGPTEPGRVLQLDMLRGLTDPDLAIKNLFYWFDRSLVIELCAYGDWGDEPRQMTVYTEENPWFDVPGNPRIDVPAVDSRKRIVTDYRDEAGIKAKTKVWTEKYADDPSNSKLGYDRSWPETLTRPPSGFFIPASGLGYHIPTAEIHSELERLRQQDEVLQILQIIEPNLKGLTVLAIGKSRLYADIGSKPLIPIELMGQGMSRILSLALAIASSPGGMLLVDEVENGLHYTVMEKVWQAIAAFARGYDVQIFATTHGHHCIQSACRAFEGDEEELLQLYSLGRRKGKISAARYDRARLEFAFEVGLGVI